MKRGNWLCLVAALLAATSGCGGGSSPAGSDASPDAGSTAVAKRDPGKPEKAVHEFLEAVRTGDDAKAALMLTPLARTKTAEHDLAVAPPGSGTASFTVGDVEYVAKDGAHVASQWSDIGEDGQTRTDAVVWMVRMENEGWRIAGMAQKVFPNEPPLFLNFEDPEDMLRKQEQLAVEIERRAAEAERQAMQPAGAGNPPALQ